MTKKETNTDTFFLWDAGERRFIVPKSLRISKMIIDDITLLLQTVSKRDGIEVIDIIEKKDNRSHQPFYLPIIIFMMSDKYKDISPDILGGFLHLDTQAISRCRDTHARRIINNGPTDRDYRTFLKFLRESLIEKFPEVIEETPKAVPKKIIIPRKVSAQVAVSNNSIIDANTSQIAPAETSVSETKAIPIPIPIPVPVYLRNSCGKTEIVLKSWFELEKNVPILKLGKTLPIMNVPPFPYFADCLTDSLCAFFEIDREFFMSKWRKREIVLVRQVGMYFCKETCTAQNGGSLSTIGKYFGGKDHATVLHAHRTISNLMDTEKFSKQTLCNFQNYFVTTTDFEDFYPHEGKLSLERIEEKLRLSNKTPEEITEFKERLLQQFIANMHPRYRVPEILKSFLSDSQTLPK